MADAQSHLTKSENLLAKIVDDYVARLRAGKSISADQYVRKYPQLEAPIRRLLATAALMEQGRPGSVSGKAVLRKDSSRQSGAPQDDASQDDSSSETRSPASPDEPAMLEYLAGQKVLTARQAAELKAGGGQGFFLGPYELLGLLGAGGMGQVFKAADTRMDDRLVAVKVLSSRVASRDAVRRFRREAETALKLQHPHIVRSFELAQHGSINYLVMELIEGVDLSKYIRKAGKLSVDETARIGFQVAQALECAHAAGIIHRDIKPSNILLTRDKQAKLADMGLAKFFSARPEGAAAMTQTGAFMGTVDYCSPEQAEDAKRASTASDIYSLGCTLYHCLTGQPPFPDGTDVQKIVCHLAREPERIEDLNPDVPPPFADLIHRDMLAKRPADRFLTPSDVVAALREWVPGESAGSSAAPNYSVLASLLEAEAAGQTVPKQEEEQRDTQAARRQKQTPYVSDLSSSPAQRRQPSAKEPAPLVRRAKSMQEAIWPPTPGVWGGALAALGLVIAICYATGVFDDLQRVGPKDPAAIAQGDNNPQPKKIKNEAPPPVDDEAPPPVDDEVPKPVDDEVPEPVGNVATTPDPIPATLFGKAGYAWEQGKLNTGLQYFYAAGLVENESQVWSKLRWCEALGRPVVALRWGIAVQTPLAGTAPAAQGAKNPVSSQGPDEAAPDDTDDRVEPDTEDEPDSDTEGDDDGGNAGAPQSATAVVSANKAASIELLRQYTKTIGPEIHRLLTEATTIKGLANTPLAFLTSLGVEKTTEDVLAKARGEAVDVVATISVIVKKIGLRGKPDAELTISIVDVASGATLWKGKSLKGRQYSYELTKGRDVGKELAAAAMAAIEKRYVLSDQPTVSFEQLDQRLSKSADREKNAPLRALAEIRYLQIKGSITAKESQQSFARLIGEDAAETLAKGTPQQKLEAVSEFLPELKAGANRAIQRLAPVRQSAQR